jgi:hypothetical protein
MAGHRVLFLLTFAPVFAAAAEPPPFPVAWQDLLSADEVKAARAVALFAGKPADGVAFLSEKLRPLKVEPKRVAKLVAELGDKDFATREAAQQELEYLGKFAKGNLEAALKEATAAEARDRLTRLLGKIARYEASDKADEVVPEKPVINGRSVSVSNRNGQISIVIDGKPLELTPKVIEKLPPPPAWTRAARAIGVLEAIGTSEAVKLLEAMALGEDNAPPTRQAQDALARLKRQK